MVEVLGSFRINKIKWTGADVQYAILFLKDRMVFAKVGGQLADFNLAATVGGVTGGAAGAAIGHLIGKKVRPASDERDEKVKAMNKMPVDKILNLDKNNFEILYKDVTSVKLKNPFNGVMGFGVWSLNVEGKKKDKFNIAPNQNFEECRKIFESAVPEKLRG